MVNTINERFDLYEERAEEQCNGLLEKLEWLKVNTPKLLNDRLRLIKQDIKIKTELRELNQRISKLEETVGGLSI